MGKNIVKHNDSASPPSKKSSSNKNLKTTKEKQKDNIVIRKIKSNHDWGSKKVKTLASDHFSVSTNNTQSKEPNLIAEKVCLNVAAVFFPIMLTKFSIKRMKPNIKNFLYL